MWGWSSRLLEKKDSCIQTCWGLLESLISNEDIHKLVDEINFDPCKIFFLVSLTKNDFQRNRAFMR